MAVRIHRLSDRTRGDQPGDVDTAAEGRCTVRRRAIVANRQPEIASYESTPVRGSSSVATCERVTVPIR